MNNDPRQPATMRLRWPALATALAIMVGGTLYAPFFADARGQADHGLALALFWAMSAGFVRGIGFIPRYPLWRWLFSGTAVVLALAAAVLVLAR